MINSVLETKFILFLHDLLPVHLTLENLYNFNIIFKNCYGTLWTKFNLYYNYHNKTVSSVILIISPDR